MAKNVIERRLMYGKLGVQKNNLSIENGVAFFSHLAEAMSKVSGRYKRKRDGSDFLVQIDAARRPLHGIIRSVRTNDLPMVADLAAIRDRPLELQDSEGLSTSMRFVLFENDVVGWEYVHDGARHSLIRELGVHFLEGVNVSIIPFLKPNARKRMKQSRGIKNIVLRLATPSAAIQAVAMNDIAGSLEVAEAADYVATFEVTMNVQKAPAARETYGDAAEELLYNMGLIDQADKAWVYPAGNRVLGKQYIDLLADVFYWKTSFVPQDARHRFISDDAMFDAIEQGYAENRTDFSEG